MQVRFPGSLIQADPEKGPLGASRSLDMASTLGLDTKTLYYPDWRSSILPGDLFFCEGRILLSKVIGRGTRSRLSHVCAATWSSTNGVYRRLGALHSKIGPGVVHESLSKFLRRYRGKVYWYKLLEVPPPDWPSGLEWNIQRAVFVRELWKYWEKGDDYPGLGQFVSSFLMGRGWDEPNAEFCSEYIHKCLRPAGWKGGKASIHTSPADLAAQPWCLLMGQLFLPEG